ncbi:unnamed protein product [Echinostoma caproni]|uniref:Protein kinase domain-containing protein n=1 Tax=Echinostoma caproni TaxID=27848 RepID=A0A183AD67_9TREM|nr:unnamed protein product [Echinostoma caproni]
MENLMFDSGGYLKLIDFGASKEMNSHPFDRTWTICGTLAYCAPEMLNGNGYDYMVDWWALGIMCYALSCGAYPVAPGRDHRDMRESINRHRYVAPAHVSTNLEQIILKVKMISISDYIYKTTYEGTMAQSVKDIHQDGYSHLSLLSNVFQEQAQW